MNKDGAKKTKKILHITPHLGGGVGTVLLNYLSWAMTHSCFSHEIAALDYANERAGTGLSNLGLSFVDRMAQDHRELLNMVSHADIVLIHWWNHPLLSAFLVKESLPPARVLFWSHISGFHAPYVFAGPALNYPDIFVFTTPLSMNIPEVSGLPRQRQLELRVIWSTSGIEHIESLHPTAHSGFNIGYIGTVDYSKLHPQFLEMSNMVHFPDSRFIVCGGPSEKSIKSDASRYGGDDRFTFTGQVSNVAEYLGIFDVFGYPLAPYHFGTCEQALGESMAAGVPPVVLANKTESHIVEDGVTGIVATDVRGYAKAIEGLLGNHDLRQRLSENARKSAIKRYSSISMVNHWEKVFDEVIRYKKHPRQWTGIYRGPAATAARIFVESLGQYGTDFARYIDADTALKRQKALDAIKELCTSSPLWQSQTRGTPRHYSHFFPDDPYLDLWKKIGQEEDKVRSQHKSVHKRPERRRP